MIRVRQDRTDVPKRRYRTPFVHEMGLFRADAEAEHEQDDEHAQAAIGVRVMARPRLRRVPTVEASATSW